MQPIQPASGNLVPAAYTHSPASLGASGVTGTGGTTMAGTNALSNTGLSSSVNASSGSTSGLSSASSSSYTSFDTTVAIHQQVDTFLSSIAEGLGENQYLKLLIAALIMQVLLGHDGAVQQTGQAGLKALESLAGGQQNSLYLAIESSTNTVQIQHQSSRLEVSGAVQSLSASDQALTQAAGQSVNASASEYAGGNQAGGQMDIVA
jgi:hypothetical protein